MFVGLLLGSWRMAQEPWRPLLFSLAIVGLLLGFWRVAQEPWRPLLLFLAIVGLLLGSWRMAQEPWRLFRHQQDRPGLCCALFSRCASKLLFLRRRCIKITSGLMLAIVVHSTLSDVECFQPVQQASLCARLLIHFAIQELR